MSLREQSTPEGLAELQRALERLELEPPVSRAELKTAYRTLSRRLHPDRNAEESAAEEMAALNQAYRLLTDYIDRFRFHLTEEEYLLQNPRIRIERQFTGHEGWKKRR